MLYFFKTHIKYLLFIVTFYSNTLYAIELESLSHAVDVAGKQRMFTQKILKDYTMIGIGNSFGNPSEDLNKTVESFENHLYALHNYTENIEIQKHTAKIKKMWLSTKKRLGVAPTKEGVILLQKELEKLLEESNTVTQLFAKETGVASGEIINISGRQRMLSQRMASLYMLKVWGIDDNKFQEKMDSSMQLFQVSLFKLQQSKLNTDKINRLLTKVENSFLFFKVMNKSKKRFIPALIYKKSDDILKNMNSVTHEYVVVSKK